MIEKLGLSELRLTFHFFGVFKSCEIFIIFIKRAFFSLCKFISCGFELQGLIRSHLDFVSESV